MTSAHARSTPPDATPREWHALLPDVVAAIQGVDPALGLGGLAVAERRRRVGPNRLREGRRRSIWSILLAQFADVMVLVLIAAAVAAGALGERGDTVAIVAIVLLNASLGFVQEYRAERAMQALRALAAPMARVRRAGELRTIESSELVPGDIVLLEAGAVVPADIRLYVAHHLRTDESTLTGESLGVDKDALHLADRLAPIGDRRSMVWKGTIVTYGRGEGIVVDTGMATALGRVATLLDEASDTQTPLQRRLRRFATQLAVVVVALSAVMFGIGVVRGEPPLVLLLTALSLAVAAMPEALPAVVTISLALGARRMVQRHALVRRLPAVETLGSVTHICSDKTGTLTQNRMTVAEVLAPDRESVGAADDDPSSTRAVLLRAIALNSDAVRTHHGVEGDPTEVALMEYALATNVDVATIVRAHPRLAELPFSSERGRMTTLHEDPGSGTPLLVMKGAPERVIPRCAWRCTGGALVPLDTAAVMAEAHQMAVGGLRVLAFASRLHPVAGGNMTLGEPDETGCTFLGLVGLLDPPRPEAKAAVAECLAAGIRVIMITGDHAATARAMASELGIADAGSPAITGESLAQVDDAALAARCHEWSVFARVAPEQKIRLVRALQATGEFVAMTGDGVNDAPALRQADIGIAMGRNGTDVAREASDMVLVDDNFASIVAAVREGRRIYDNIRRFIRYVLTGNSAEIWLLLFAPLLGLPLPLLPIHILWVNLVTDGLPGLALALEPEERDVMRRPPRRPSENIFSHGLWQHAVWVGMLMGAMCLATQAWAIHAGSANWQSMTFTVLALSQLGHVLAVRSERESLLGCGLWSNPALMATVVATTAVQLTILYVPPLARALRVAPLMPDELAVCLAMACVTLIAVEAEKFAARRGWLYREPAAPRLSQHDVR